jgi:hypothetical protein
MIRFRPLILHQDQQISQNDQEPSIAGCIGILPGYLSNTRFKFLLIFILFLSTSNKIE